MFSIKLLSLWRLDKPFTPNYMSIAHLDVEMLVLQTRVKIMKYIIVRKGPFDAPFQIDPLYSVHPFSRIIAETAQVKLFSVPNVA